MIRTFFSLALFILCLLSTNMVLSQVHTQISLEGKCLNALEPAVKRLGMIVDDLKDSTNAMKLKKHLVKEGQWASIRSVCFPDYDFLPNSKLLTSCCQPCHCSASECCYWAGRFCNNCQCCAEGE